MHFDPLRPNRALGNPDPYEFAHGRNSLCVYRSDTMEFVKEIPVGKGPDCHALSCSGNLLYLATLDGTYVIDTKKLEVVSILDTGEVYATNTLPDGDTVLIHDNYGGLYVLKNAEDPHGVYAYRHLQLIGDGKVPAMLGGKGQFLPDGRYLCAGWHAGHLFAIDPARDYEWEIYMPACEELLRGDDLVLSADRRKAYIACHRDYYPAHVSVVDLENRKVLKTIRTGNGTCGLTMTDDERYIVASNDKDASISVIDTLSDEVVRTICAREGFMKLKLPESRIQGISANHDGSVFVYECSGYGALVRFSDLLDTGAWTVADHERTFVKTNYKIGV